MADLNAAGPHAWEPTDTNVTSDAGHRQMKSNTIAGSFASDPLARALPAAGGMRPAFARACWWLAQGVHVVPLQPNSKRLIAGFGPYRSRITSVNEARVWFARNAHNLGIVAGTGDLTVVDFDNAVCFQPWLDSHPEIDTLVESSLDPGCGHVFFFDAEAVNGVGVGLEVKARNRIVTVYPSVVDGNPYSILRDAPILRANVETLFSLLSKKRPTRPSPAQIPPSLSSLRARGVRDDLISRIKKSRPIFDLANDLLASRGGLRSSDGGRGRWYIGRCPFHDDWHPSFWLDAERGLFGCRVKGCIASEVGDVISLYALANGLENRDAIIELARGLL